MKLDDDRRYTFVPDVGYLPDGYRAKHRAPYRAEYDNSELDLDDELRQPSHHAMWTPEQPSADA